MARIQLAIFFLLLPSFVNGQSQCPTLSCEAAFFSRDVSSNVCISALTPSVGINRAADLCYLQCTICCVGSGSKTFFPFAIGADGVNTCVMPPESAVSIITDAASAIVNSSALHGQYFLDYPGGPEENATIALQFLLTGMPRRDFMLLATDTSLFLDFLIEHVRYALHTRAWSLSRNVSWDIFADGVLPYAMADESRNLWFRWRPRFARIFASSLLGANTTTDVMHAIADAIPRAQVLGVLSSQVNVTTEEMISGPTINWKSETSPAFISVEQVAAFGGSCTGTGIVLVAAARALGIPARLAGCGETDVRGDDHHWAEFYDASSIGPFGDFWHTKEGTSKGNEGGPWDAPSGPMNGCLIGVVPFSPIDSLWAASWISSTYMPLLWSNDSWSAQWSFVGGVDRCGAICSAWGCGVNNSFHWSQKECSQFPAAVFAN